MQPSLPTRQPATAWAATALALTLGASSGCKEPEITARVSSGEVVMSLDAIKQANIIVEPASEHEISDTLVTSGRVAFEDIKVGHVFSLVTGRVSRIDVGLGAKVKAGQLLAVIDSPDVGSATSDVAKADADLIAAEHGMQREKQLLAKEATSRKDYETTEDAYRQAQAEKQRALQKAFLLRTRGIGSVTQGYTLVSPLDGEVLARNLSVGTEVQGQYSGGTQELFAVGELDEVWVLADIYEIDLARVRIAAKCVVHTVAHIDESLEGKVDWIARVLDPATRTAKVRCTFANPDRLLKPDMFATVTISVAPRMALSLPRSAILHLGDKTVVFFDRGAAPGGSHHFERLPVQVDEALGGRWVPVSHGLDVGNPVVTQGAEALQAKL